MRPVPRACPLIVMTLALCGAACSGGSTSTKTPTPTATATRAAVASPAPATRPPAPPAPATTPAPSSAAVPIATPAGACLQFALKPVDVTAAGTQPQRPPVAIDKFDIAVQDIGIQFTKQGKATFDPQESRTAEQIAGGSADPQASYRHLVEIGYLGGRVQQFAEPLAQGIIPTVTVLHLVFNTDAGAANFLQDPVSTAGACIRKETAAPIGQESQALFYAANSAGGGPPFQGHGLLWRCGRVVLNVTAGGAPGHYSLADVSAWAQKVQAQFLSTGQPCS